jgi:putative colanic acid biosynthesis UDP-glucose lipid carrier transferase
MNMTAHLEHNHRSALMPQEQRNTRVFLNAPQSTGSFISAFLEPALIIVGFIAASIAGGSPVDRAGIAMCLLVFALSFPGVNRFKQKPLNAAIDVLLSWSTLLTILALCGYATDSFKLFDERVLVAWGVGTPLLLYAAAVAGGAWLRREAQQPSARRAVAVVGGGPLGVRVAGALGKQHEFGVDFTGYFDDRTDDRLAPEARNKRLGSLNELRDHVLRHGIKEVYITLPLGSQPRIVQLLASLQDTTASLYFVPDVFGISIVQGRLQDIDGVPVVGLLETPFTGANRLIKRLSDIVLASIILVLISPILAAVAIGVKLSSPGPVIFKQKRNGLDGGEITVYKFRSMRTQDNGPVIQQATKGDPRVTPFGAFIRKTSLDELPQFINVLQGRMSIVGPRPHAVAHNEQYRRMIKAYMVRHKVKPGITGWAQINGHRGETDTVDKMQARVAFDLEYLSNWSLALDLQIIARTIKLMLFDRNAY